MHSIYKILLFSFFITPLLSQPDNTILGHLQKGEVLKLEWVHQQYLSENGSQPNNYPLYPDQMKEGEGEVFVGLKLQMEQCIEKPCNVKIWIEYVSSVQFPERQKVKPSLDLMNPTTPEAAKHFPKMIDTRYRFKNDKSNSLTDGDFTKKPIVVDLAKGLEEQIWNNLKFKEDDLPNAFNFFYLKQFLANLWQQEWVEKSHYKSVYQQTQFDKLSIHFYKPKFSPKTTIISGKIKNAVTNTIELTGLDETNQMRFWIKEVYDLDSNNVFEISTHLTQPIIFTVFHGFYIQPIYVEPGDSLHIDFDANAFYRNTLFSGDNNLANQFLLNFYHELKGDSIMNGLDRDLLKKSQRAYLESKKTKEKQELAYLNSHQKRLTPTFLNYMDRRIRFSYARDYWYHADWFYMYRDAQLIPEYMAHAQQLSSYFFRLPEKKGYGGFLSNYLRFQKILLKGKYTNRPIYSPSHTGNFEFAQLFYSPRNAYRVGKSYLFTYSKPTGSDKSTKLYETLKKICVDTAELAHLATYTDDRFNSDYIVR